MTSEPVVRPLRIAGRLRGAAEAHDAPVWRVGLRAARLRREGWRLGEAASFGLLDPRLDLGSVGWTIPATEMERLQEALNPGEAAALAEDKRLFAAVCARHGLPAARQVGVLERNGDGPATAAAWAAALARDAPDDLVVKPSDGHRGLGVRVLARADEGVADDAGRAIAWDALARELAADRWRSYVVQERVRPHAELERMSGTEVLHTLRMVALRGPDAPPRLLAARLRIPAGHLPVNSFRAGTSGNLAAAVRGDGTLALPFTARPGGFGLDPAPVHPLTGVTLEGFPVPGWEDARELALRAVEAFAPLRAVGLDVAPTPGGPMLIEANAWWRWIPDPRAGDEPAFAALRAAAAGCP